MYFVIFCPQFNSGYTNACCEVNLYKKICAMFGMEMSSVLETHSAKSLNFMSTKSLQLEGSSFYRFTSRCTEISRFLSIKLKVSTEQNMPTRLHVEISVSWFKEDLPALKLS